MLQLLSASCKLKTQLPALLAWGFGPDPGEVETAGTLGSLASQMSQISGPQVPGSDTV